jgi:hypothetical protein
VTRATPLALTAAALMLFGCQGSSTPPASPTTPAPTPTPTPSTSSIAVTFDENPVPFRSSDCSFSTPQGWYTQARLRETGGVSLTPSTLTQKLDGNTVSFLAESFGSRFGACSGTAFTPGVIAANGAVCGVVGVCTASAFTTYQFSVSGTDANGHALTFESPVLQLGTRPAGQASSIADLSLTPRAPTPMPRVGQRFEIHP